MTKAECRRNGTIVRTRYYETPEQAQDALVETYSAFPRSRRQRGPIGFIRGVCSDALQGRPLFSYLAIREIHQPRI
jgi:hypothetical protein